MMAAEVDGSGNSFEARKEQALFKVADWGNSQYEVTPDGKRFVIITQKVTIQHAAHLGAELDRALSQQAVNPNALVNRADRICPDTDDTWHDPSGNRTSDPDSGTRSR